MELLIYCLTMMIMLMHLVEILIHFFDTCIIFASLPSHSATSLGAVLLYVQCVCFPAGFGLFMFWSIFVLQAFVIFLENQGCDITRLTF